MFRTLLPLAFVVLADALPTLNIERGSAPRATKPKTILDNDWGAGGWDPWLLALAAGWDVLGVTACTGNTWEPQVALHALGSLDFGNLSCIPVYEGAIYPLINTYDRFQAWESIHGKLAWQGVYEPYNATAEAEGADPTAGDNPYRIVKGAFTDEFPTTAAQTSQSAVQFMIEQVHKYPGEVSIFAAGAMTNVALAVKTDPKFASLAKELVIMGGYIDDNLFQATGTVAEADINSDFNLMIDPEAAKIALTANFPNIILAGNVANSVYPNQKWLDQLLTVNTSYTEWTKKYLDMDFPFWDSIAAAIMVEPSIVLNQSHFYLDVDISYGSPNYGNVHVYQKALTPPGLRNITYVNEINGTRFLDMLTEVYQNPITCKDL